MRLEVLFSTLAALVAVATAVPVQQEYPDVPMPTPSKPVIPSPAASAHASTSASPSASLVPVGPYSCPQNQFKQCCQSLVVSHRRASENQQYSKWLSGAHRVWAWG